jgi:hypothetical protein
MNICGLLADRSVIFLPGCRRIDPLEANLKSSIFNRQSSIKEQGPYDDTNH